MGIFKIHWVSYDQKTLIVKGDVALNADKFVRDTRLGESWLKERAALEQI